jgi:hypothetical protein
MKKSTIAFLTSLLASICILTGAVQNMEPAPDFTLVDTNGVEHSLSDFAGKMVVLEWLNHECPFVVKHYKSENMQKLQEKWTTEGVIWLSINSTHPTRRDYKTPEEANALSAKYSAKPTAVLMDPDGTVGKLYGAKTTPHMYVINKEGVLIYQGAIDSEADADQKSVAKATNYVESALNRASYTDNLGDTAFTKAYGCSVKYAK